MLDEIDEEFELVGLQRRAHQRFEVGEFLEVLKIDSWFQRPKFT